MEETQYDPAALPAAPKDGAIVEMVVNVDGLKWRTCGNFAREAAGAGPSKNAIVIGTALVGADGGHYVKCIVHKNPYGDQHLYLPRFSNIIDPSNGKYVPLLLSVDMNWACNGTKQFKILNRMVLHRSTCFDDTLPEDPATIIKAGTVLTGHAVAGADDYNYLMTTVQNPATGGYVICFLPAQAKSDSSIKFAVQVVQKGGAPARKPAAAQQRAPAQRVQQRAPAAPPPPPAAPMNDWIEAFTEDNEQYWYNQVTQETTWDKPF